MSIISWLMSAIRGEGKVQRVSTPTKTIDTLDVAPTVRFNPNRVTEAVKIDLERNIKKIREFDETHFDVIYDAALRSISRGRNLSTLYNAILELNLSGMTKRRASEISLSLNNKATALKNGKQQMSVGAKYAIWTYSGAPCQVNPRKPSAKDVRRNAAHKAANGKRYEVAKGMFIDGRLTIPGREEGCKCIARPVIPGLEP